MGWLVLKRRMGETIQVGNSVVLVNRIKGAEVSIGILAPEDVRIVRGELVPDSEVQNDACDNREDVK